MFAVKTPSLKEVCVMKIAEILWSQTTVVERFYQLLPTPLTGRELKKDQLDFIGEEVKKSLSQLEIPAATQFEIHKVIEPIGWQLIDWINDMNYEFYGAKSKDHYELYSNSYYLKCLLWSIRGTIDKKATVEIILTNERISVEKRFELACIFCCDNQVSVLYPDLSSSQKSKFLPLQGTENLDISGEHINPLFVYWSFVLENQTDKIVNWENDGLNVNEYLALWAIKNNKQVAFSYFWDQLTEVEKNRNVVKYIDSACTFHSMNGYDRGTQLRRRASHQSLNDFAQLYTNIVAYLLPQLYEEQLTEILVYNSCTFLMSFFLHWIWHDHFVKLLTHWDCLSDVEIEALLLGIVAKSPSKFEYKEFKEGLEVVVKKNASIFKDKLLAENCKVFWKLFVIKDSGILKIALNAISPAEKRDIILTNLGVARSKDLIMKGEFDYLDVFIEGSLLFDEDKSSFRRHLFQSPDSLCNYLLLENKFDTFMKFVTWSEINEEEVENLKLELIDEGQTLFVVKILLVNHSNLDDMGKFVSWCFSSCVESIAEFKQTLVENESACSFCTQLVNKEKFDVAKEFLKWCGYNKDEADSMVQELLMEFANAPHY